jgi:putative cardiolipin synthase
MISRTRSAGTFKVIGPDLASFLSVLLLCLLVLGVAGCARLPTQAPRPLSMSIPDDGNTYLGYVARAASPSPNLSGFRLLPMPPFALEARLELARRAERSIDVQYYLIQNDVIGRTLLRALRDAALRGVRVRILVDDLYTASTDAMLRTLAAYPGIEIRLFNPFPAARSSLLMRFAASILDFNRLNRRMHNKFFVVDGAMAVVGGRNIANEYFVSDSFANFIDIDVLIAGPLVPRLSSLFDMFWNSTFVYPIESLVPVDASDAALRSRFESTVSAATTPMPVAPDSRDLLGYNPLARDLEGPRALDMVWAHAEAYSDPPDKVLSTARAGEPLPESASETVLYRARALVRAAEHEVIETMPYLIPGKEGMESMRRLRARDVRFVIVTNSLAANDEALVHASYARYRTEMLRLGVELYELSPERSIKSHRFGIHGTGSGRLHAKSAVIDRRTVFIGSLNFDPRSDAENTELGVFIYSPAIASQVYSLIGYIQQEGAYKLRLNASDQSIEWVSPLGDGTRESVLHSEPETSFWMRWKLKLLAPFVPEGLL